MTKTTAERQLEVAMATLHEVRFNPIIAHALAEIGRIGEEGEVDAAIEILERCLRASDKICILSHIREIQSLIAEVWRLRAEVEDDKNTC